MSRSQLCLNVKSHQHGHEPAGEVGDRLVGTETFFRGGLLERNMDKALDFAEAMGANSSTAQGGDFVFLHNRFAQ